MKHTRLQTHYHTILSFFVLWIMASLITPVCPTASQRVPHQVDMSADLDVDVYLPLVSNFDWELVWSDEFNISGAPDPTHWDYELGYIRNDELQCYTNRPENVRVENGTLIIQSRKESYNGFDYTSASVVTKGKASWTYGRVEVRAQLPQGRGMWPAIWMLGNGIDTVGWPSCGEIDIMENVGFTPNTIYANVHTEAYNHAIGTGKGDTITVTDPWAGFHIYAVEWDAEQITFFVDGQRYFSFANEHSGTATWPFDQPHYLIINAAVGGSWGGQQGVDDSIFPTTYVIDYVRVYQR